MKGIEVMEIVKNTFRKGGKRITKEVWKNKETGERGKLMNKNERNWENGDCWKNQVIMIQDNSNITQVWMKVKKKSENREKNESVERELRPSNTPLPMDEMELEDKSQKKEWKTKGKKEQDMKMRKSWRRKERLEKTPSLKTVRPLS